MKIFTSILLLSCYSFFGQIPNFQWAKQAGNTLDDEGRAITIDASGNVYTTGFFQISADFDPGPSSYTLAATAGADVFIQKLDATGNLVWARSIPGNGTDYGLGISVDGLGDVYVTGYFSGNTDLDPGPGTYTVATIGGADVFVLKLNSAGNFIWAKTIGGTGADEAYSIGTDLSGNVYVTGNFQNTVDFDPAASTYTIASFGNYDAFILKLDNSGNFSWARNLGGNAQENSKDLIIDPTGNIYSTGYFSGTADFDPGPGTFTFTSAGLWDVFVSKLDPSGNFVWAKQLGGSSFDEAYSITIDAANNILTTGRFAATADFDPGASTFTLTTPSFADIFISKLDINGNFVWAKQFTGPNFGYGNGIFADAYNNVYISGNFQTTTDFDPGPGTYTLTSVGAFDVFITKLNSAGNFLWSRGFGGPGAFDDFGRSIITDSQGSVYTAGSFSSLTDFDPGPGTYTLNTSGGANIFVHKLCETPATPISILGSNTVCAGSVVSYSVIPDPFAASYVWSIPGSWSGTSTTSILTTTAGITSGNISVTSVNSCGNSATQTLSVTVFLPPVITVNSGSICSGSSFTMIPSGAVTYTYSSGSAIVSPTTNSTYSVSGTSINGCVSVTPAISSVSVMLLPVIAASSSSAVCSGSLGCLTASGGNTYSWAGPCGFSSNIQSPCFPFFSFCNCTYSVTGTDVNGCSNTATVCLNINSTPTINILASSNSICAGQSATMTVNGGNTYTWSTASTATMITITPSSTATYSVAGTDLNGCVGSSAQSLTVNPIPVLTVTVPTTACNMNNICLNASGAVTYSWTGPCGFSSTSQVPCFNINQTCAGAYTLSGTDALGCSNTITSSFITVNPTPTLTVTNNGFICAGTNANYYASGANTFTWSSGANTSSISVPSINTGTTTIPLTQTVTGTDMNGCVSSATSSVGINPIPQVTITATNDSICLGQSDTLIAITHSMTTSYNWIGLSSGTTSAIITPTITSIYGISVMDFNGCTGGTSITITVLSCVGVGELSNINTHINIFPSPTSGEITVSIDKLSENLSIEIHNTLGQIIFKKNITDTKTKINLSEQANGVYFIKIIENGESVYHSKIIKQ